MSETTLKIKKLQLFNYRNIEADIIQFSEHINCILGENGNGKTNILEAIYYLANRKSFRKNTSFPQILGIDGEKPEIIFSSVLQNNGDLLSYTGKVNEQGQNWFLNGKATRKKLNLKVVFINPFDSFHFHNTPSFRRTWIDHHLSLLDNDYKSHLKRYNQFLKNRNALLTKKPGQYREQIRAIDQDLAPLSVYLTAKRKGFLEELSPLTSQIFKNIFDEIHQLDIHLDTEFNSSTAENAFNALRQGIEADSQRGHTQAGVHKDDYVLHFDGLNSYDYCSLGQQKMSYLSLLFAYIELFRYKFNAYPIVLIDDVSGELDRLRWKRLVDYLKICDFQVLITTANEDFKEELNRIEDARKIFINSGTITNQIN